MSNLALKINRHFYIFVFFAAAAFFYALLFVFQVQTDIQKHIDVCRAIMYGANFPPNFLYFVAVCLAALFRDDTYSLFFASLIVLSFAVALKFLVTARLFARQIETVADWSQSGLYFVSNVISVCLITAVCIYVPKEIGLTEYFLLGQVSPNVWHNSTTIFLMPFAVLLFWHSHLLIEKFEMKHFWWVIGLIALNILIKPSFFLCFGIVFPIIALIRFKFKKEFFLCLAPVCFGFVLMVLEYIAIYKLGSYGKAGESGIAVAPFEWWSLYASNIPFSILISAAFPLVYLIFYYRRVASESFLYYAYLLFVVGIAILAFLNETGPRATHGNFQWQAIISNYILFFAVATDFVKNILQKGKIDLKDKIIAGVFALHVASGWLYLVKTLLRGNYG